MGRMKELSRQLSMIEKGIKENSCPDSIDKTTEGVLVSFINEGGSKLAEFKIKIGNDLTRHKQGIHRFIDSENELSVALEDVLYCLFRDGYDTAYFYFNGGH